MILYIQEDAALTIDAVDIIVKTVEMLLNDSAEVFRTTFRRGDVYNHNHTKGIPCNAQVPWMHGKQIMEKIKQV